MHPLTDLRPLLNDDNLPLCLFVAPDLALYTVQVQTTVLTLDQQHLQTPQVRQK